MDKITKRRLLGLIKRTRVDPETGCFVWLGSVANSGYGQYRTGETNLLVHRIAYTTFIGEAPKGFHVHHRCGTRLCWNPAHLELLSLSDHWRIGNTPSAKRARQTHCQHGHEFTPRNTYITKRGHRRCRICHTANERKRRKGA